MTASEHLFEGTYTALVTPFRSDKVDWATLEKLVERQIAAGVEGVVPCGSTGESATLSHDEHDKVIEAVIKTVNGRCKVIAGTGSNSTAEAVRLTRHAAEVGADGALVVTPYYNRPTQEGMYLHFSAVAQAVNLPVVLYNVPSRCSIDLNNATVGRLFDEYETIVAIKDASGGVSRVAELAGRIGIDVLSGDDSFTLPMMSLGARGVISVMSNLVPDWMKTLVDAASQGNYASARTWHLKACGLADEIGVLGPNPLPLKTAMSLLGLLENEYRLPLCPMAESARVEAEGLLRKYELI